MDGVAVTDSSPTSGGCYINIKSLLPTLACKILHLVLKLGLYNERWFLVEFSAKKPYFDATFHISLEHPNRRGQAGQVNGPSKLAKLRWAHLKRFLSDSEIGLIRSVLRRWKHNTANKLGESQNAPI